MKWERHCTLGGGEARYWQDVFTCILSSVKQSKFLGISLWTGREESAGEICIEWAIVNGRTSTTSVASGGRHEGCRLCFLWCAVLNIVSQTQNNEGLWEFALSPSYVYYLLKSSKRFSLSSKLEKIYASDSSLRLEIPSYLSVSTSILATQQDLHSCCWTYSSNKIWGKLP